MLGLSYHTTIDIINHSTIKVVAEMTLEEAFTRHKPLISHIHVFGSDAYVHISDTT